MPRFLPHPGFAAAVCLAAGVALAPTPAAAADWQLLETPRFTIVSQLREAPTRRWADEFNQFIVEFSRLVRVEDNHLPPLTVVLFGRERAFDPYKPRRSDGRGPAPVDGFFNAVGSWSVIGLAESFDNESTRQLIFHEGVHWFMSGDIRRYPLWFDEGIAEVFSTFHVVKDTVQWGSPVTAHVQRLQVTPMLPLSRLLFITRDDPLFNETNRTSVFYAQAWLFVHYLIYGERAGAGHALSDYLAALADAMHPDDAFRQAFGGDYQQVEAALKAYISGGRYRKASHPIVPEARVTQPMRAAPPHVVEVALARLAVASRRLELARTHAARAIQLAPEDPGGHELAALLADEAEDAAGTLAAAQTAVRLGSDDARTLFLLAYHRTIANRSFGGLAPTEAREVADLYHRVLRVRPTDEQAYKNLAGLASLLEVVRDDDMDALARGGRIFPRAGEILLGLAQMIEQRGDRDTAIKVLAEARRRGLPLETRGIASQVEQHWIYEDYTARAETLLAAQRFDEAIAVLDELLPRLADVRLRAAIVRERRGVAQQQQLARAETAWNAGRMDEARNLLEGLLAQTELPAPTRRFVQDQLRRIPPAE